MIDVPTFEVFCADPQLLGEPITASWGEFFKVIEGLRVTNPDFVNACMGRSEYMPHPYVEATAIVGRRGEKTRTSIKYLLWRALYARYEQMVPKPAWYKRIRRHGERLRIVFIAQNLRIAQDAQRTAESLVLASPIVSREVASILQNEILFKNGVSLIHLPAGKASVRGLTIPCALIDELAWISLDNANDKELLRSLRPAMLQFGASRRLLKCSTPWQRSGQLYEEFSSRASRPDLLVWQAATQMMTHRISAEELERERVSDPAYFQREFMAEFTSDLETFIPWPDIDAAVQHWNELGPAADPYYIAALDASGLTGGDAFTFGLGHSGEDGFIVDVLRGWRRSAVPQVCDEVAALCRAFRIHSITADQFSFSFLAELLRQRDVRLEQLAFSARSKPEIHFDLKNLLAQGKIQLPNHPEMIRELRALESVRTSGGNYKIGAPRGQHDDFVTVLSLLANKGKRSSRTLFIPEIITLGEGPSPGTWRDPRGNADPYDARVDFPGEKWHRL